MIHGLGFAAVVGERPAEKELHLAAAAAAQSWERTDQQPGLRPEQPETARGLRKQAEEAGAVAVIEEPAMVWVAKVPQRAEAAVGVPQVVKVRMPVVEEEAAEGPMVLEQRKLAVEAEAELEQRVP